MNKKALEDVFFMAQKGLTLLAVCDESGVPHIAAAGKLEYHEGNQVAVTDWFCPGIVANASPGKPISIVVWDPQTDTGHQLTGNVKQVVDYGALDGYTSLEEKHKPLPQMQRTLFMEVANIMAFSKAPHSDLEE